MWVSYGEVGKNISPNLIQPFLKILIEGTITTEAGRLFQYFTTLTEKGRYSPPAITLTLEYLIGVPS